MSIENYFDYFKSIELDISEFNYDNNIEYSNVQPITFEMLNIYAFTDINFDVILENYTEDYILNSEERPETLSVKLYGSVDFWWVNLLINRKSMYDFPMSSLKIKQMVQELYDNEYKYSYDTYYNILKRVNELKTNFKVVKKDYLYLVLREIYNKISANE